MSFSSKRLLVVGLFGATLLFHLAVAGQDFAVLAENGFLYDDSFYAFKIAENVAHGNGASFDGERPTNGFQPLYVCLLVPFYWIFRSSLFSPIYAALALSALFSALSAVLMFKIVGRYTSSKVAVAAALIWAFSPVVTRQTANGLETALALCFFAWVVYFYLSRIRPVNSPRRRDFVIFGVLVGLSILARVDEAFLALVIALDYLLVLRKRAASSRAISGMLVSAAAALVVNMPWLIYSAVVVGTLLQDSGAATRYLSLAYAPFFGLGSERLAATGPTAGFLWGHVVHSFSVLKLTPPVHAFFRGAERLDMGIGAGKSVMLLADVAGLLLIATIGYVVVAKKKSLRVRGFDEIQFLLLVIVALLCAYSLFVFGVFFFARYYYPVYFILCIYAGLLLEEAVRRLRGRRAVFRRVAVVLASVYAAAFAYMAYSCACRSHQVYCFYEAARWVDEHTSPGETVGVFQGGAVGYFSSRRVVNLDGKVNRDALDALRSGNLGDYLRKEGIDVVVDNRNVLELFLTGRFDDTHRVDPLVSLGLHPILEGPGGKVPGWAAYRVNGFASSRR
jgi:hypothetical protein